MGRRRPWLVTKIISHFEKKSRQIGLGHFMTHVGFTGFLKFAEFIGAALKKRKQK